MTIRLPFYNAPHQASAAQFIAELVKQGLTYSACQDKDDLVITLTGGY